MHKTEKDLENEFHDWLRIELAKLANKFAAKLLSVAVSYNQGTLNIECRYEGPITVKFLFWRIGGNVADRRFSDAHTELCTTAERTWNALWSHEPAKQATDIKYRHEVRVFTSFIL